MEHAKPLPQPPPEAKLDPMEEFKRDPLIRKALEIFRANTEDGHLIPADMHFDNELLNKSQSIVGCSVIG